MTTLKSWARVFAVAAGICLWQAGYAPADSQTSQQSSGTARPTKTVVLVPPAIKAYEISAGGVPELMDDWSKMEVENVTRALFANFSTAGRKITALKTDSSVDSELTEVIALFTVIRQSNALQTNSASLGSLESILQRSGGVALLSVQDEDQFATAGKKTLNVLGTITGVAASALTGNIIIPKMERSMLRMALADSNGTIIWHNLTLGGADMRDPANCYDVVNSMLETFPRLDK